MRKIGIVCDFYSHAIIINSSISQIGISNHIMIFIVLELFTCGKFWTASSFVVTCNSSFYYGIYNNRAIVIRYFITWIFVVDISSRINFFYILSISSIKSYFSCKFSSFIYGFVIIVLFNSSVYRTVRCVYLLCQHLFEPIRITFIAVVVWF